MMSRFVGDAVIRRLLTLVGFWLASSSAFASAEPHLSPRNLEVPFPYLLGGTREWPILERLLPEGTRIEAVVRDGDAVLNGEQVAVRGLKISVTANGRLQVTAKNDATASLRVEVVIKRTDPQASPPLQPERRS